MTLSSITSSTVLAFAAALMAVSSHGAPAVGHLAPALGQSACTPDSARNTLSTQDSILGFERRSVIDGVRSRDWAVSYAGGFSAQLDSGTRVDGRHSMHLRTINGPTRIPNRVGFGGLLAAEFAGRSVTIRACIKTTGVTRGAGLFAQISTRGPQDVSIQLRADSSTRGPTDWHSVSFAVDVPPNVNALQFGAALWGEGELWADHFTVVRDENVYSLPGYEAPPADAIEWTRRHADVLEVRAGGSLAEPESLAEKFGGARFVLLGEATHGTADFTRLKTQIVLSLVRSRQVRVVALEANLEEVERLNAFINQRGALPELLYWTYQSREFHDFVDSLRTLNAARPGAVTLFGIDAQGAPGESVESVRAFIARVDPAYTSTLDSLYRAIPEPKLLPTLVGGSPMINQWYFSALAVRRHLDTLLMRAQRVNADTGDLVVARHHADRLVQEPMGRFDAQYRDSSMAANLFWLSEHHEGRIAAWMHNLHAMKSPERTGGYLSRVVPAGAVYSLALLFGEGSYVATGPKGLSGYPSATPAVGSIERILGDLGAPIVYLGLSALQSDAGGPAWFRAPLQWTAIGAGVSGGSADVAVLASAFDGVLYVRRASPATGIR